MSSYHPENDPANPDQPGKTPPADAREGVAAFTERRKARFTGR